MRVHAYFELFIDCEARGKPFALLLYWPFKAERTGIYCKKKKYLLEHTSEYRPQGGKIHQR